MIEGIKMYPQTKNPGRSLLEVKVRDEKEGYKSWRKWGKILFHSLSIQWKGNELQQHSDYTTWKIDRLEEGLIDRREDNELQEHQDLPTQDFSSS